MLYRTPSWRPGSWCLALGGLASVAALFVPDVSQANEVVLSATFLCLAVFGMLGARHVRMPFSLVSVALAMTTMTFFLAFGLAYLLFGPYGDSFGLGHGGLERLLAYPVLVWCIGMGGYLMGGSVSTSKGPLGIQGTGHYPRNQTG